MARKKTEDQIVKDMIARRDEYRTYAKDNVYGELQEVWRGINCRTKKRYKLNAAGKETGTEDTSQTNVAMTDLAVMYWRNIARMSAQPPRMRYIGSVSPLIADQLSALFRQQYDRSNEVVQDVRLTMSCEAFGFGYTKLYEDSLERTMVFRKAIMKGDDVVYRNRASIMRYQGAPEDEISGAVDELGEDMSDDEITKFLSSDRGAKVITVPTEVKKYEGPCVKFVFPGNLFLSPRALTLNESDSIIEQYQQDAQWLRWMSSKTFKNPKTGETQNVFNTAAVAELIKSRSNPSAQLDDLRTMFENATGKDTDESYKFPRGLSIRKKWNFIEEHYVDDDGFMCVRYCSEDYRDQLLGYMCYPWDLYGHSVYTEEVPMPDLLSPWGNSTPRLNRYLFQMHNRTVAQNFDFITNLIKKLFLVKDNAEISEEVVRGMFREIRVSNLDVMKPMEEGQLPAGAMEREQQILRMMSMLETSLAATDSGTTTNPMAGKTATSQVIASKISDAMLQFKVSGRDIHLREQGQKKLWMNQQIADDAAPWEIGQTYWNDGLKKRAEGLPQPPSANDPESMGAYQKSLPEWALSDRFGRVTATRLDPLEIQEDIDVEPESMSYMSVNDDLKKQSADEVAQMALEAPTIIDPRKAALLKLSTIPNIGNPSEYIVPEQPPDPTATVKKNMNFTLPVKWEDLPSGVQAQILEATGVQMTPEILSELKAGDLAKGVQTLSKASDASANLMSPAQAPQPANGKPIRA